MTHIKDDAAERWDENAAQWHRFFAENDLNRRYLLDPLILQALGDVSHKRLLDAGCGDGYMSRKLARLGAQVTGVDRSKRMLVFALQEQEKEPLRITYHNASITSLPFLSDGSFDIVLTNNVIQDMEDYQAALKELSRLLRPGGAYLQVVNHPCFATTPVSDWVRDENGKRLFRKVDYYFRRGAVEVAWPPQTGMKPTTSWHRTLGDMANALISCGLHITRLIEPEPSEEYISAYPDRAEHDGRIPIFLIFVCRRQ